MARRFALAGRLWAGRARHLGERAAKPPFYFAVPVWLFLIARRDWRTLASWSHLAGLAMFAAVIGAWQIPFTMQMGWAATRDIWTGDALRCDFADVCNGSEVGLHLLLFPFEIAICTLPWSPLLIAYLSREFRRSIDELWHSILLLVIAIAVAFPTCWLQAPARGGRYLMPLYPCLALLVGLVVQRALEPAASRLMRRGWSALIWTHGTLILFAGLVVAGATWIPRFYSPQVTQPGWFAALYLAVALVASAVLWFNHSATQPVRARAMLLVIGAFIGLSYQGVVVNGMAQASENVASTMADLKSRLPADVRLVSFGMVETQFTDYYGRPVEQRRWPNSPGDGAADSDYFCFTWGGGPPPELPFGWRAVGMISCDRLHHDHPQRMVIVGQRLDSLAARTTQLR